MAITTSQMGAFEDAVIALIKAEMTNQGEGDVQVAVGPLRDDAAREFIHSIGSSTSQDWASLGRGRKRQELQLTLVVYSTSVGGSEDSNIAVRDRVEFLAAIVEVALRNGVNLPTVGPVRRVQVDSIDHQRLAAFHNSDDSAEMATITVTGLADLYIT